MEEWEASKRADRKGAIVPAIFGIYSSAQRLLKLSIWQTVAAWTREVTAVGMEKSKYNCKVLRR